MIERNLKLLDDSNKPLISFSAAQTRQEINESVIKFRYATKERQRKLNYGKKIDPEQDKQRHEGLFSRTLKLNMTKGQLFSMDLIAGFNINVHPLTDDFGRFVFPTDPNYYKIKPIWVTITVSNKTPDYLEKFDNNDLHMYINKFFGDYILEERNLNKINKLPELKSANESLWIQSKILVLNEKVGQDNLNKNAFNVFGSKYFEHEMNYMNKRLEMMGFPKLKPSEALFKTEKTIEKPSYYIFEQGEN